MVKITIVQKNNNKYELDINNFDKTEIHNLLNNDNVLTNFKKLETYEFDDEVVELWGYDKGKEKNINILELLEDKLFYDDLVFIVKNLNGELIDFLVEDFDDFYISINEGFENLSECEEEDNNFIQDEDYEDDGFVVFD